jgi:hypothetical protein
VMSHVFDLHEDFITHIDGLLPDEPHKSSAMQFHPISPSMVSRGAGVNVLGLEDDIASGAGVVWVLQMEFDSVEAEEIAYPLALEFQAEVDAYASEVGVQWRFTYLNYADPSKDPIKSYGRDNVNFLQRVSKEYDPKGVFQKLRKSGHKLPKKTCSKP